MDKFKYQHSQLLQLLYEAHKDGLVDQDEKVKIKGILSYIIFRIDDEPKSCFGWNL